MSRTASADTVPARVEDRFVAARPACAAPQVADSVAVALDGVSEFWQLFDVLSVGKLHAATRERLDRSAGRCSDNVRASLIGAPAEIVVVCNDE